MIEPQQVDLRQRALTAADAARAHRHRSVLLRMAASRALISSHQLRTGAGQRAATRTEARALQARLRAAKATQARAARLPEHVERVVANALRLVQQSMAHGATAVAADALTIVERVHDATERAVDPLPGR
jgi:hypothetical protein